MQPKILITIKNPPSQYWQSWSWGHTIIMQPQGWPSWPQLGTSTLEHLKIGKPHTGFSIISILLSYPNMKCLEYFCDPNTSLLKLLKSQWQKSKSKVLLASFPSYCPLSALRFPIPFHQFLLSMFWAPILGKWTHENLSQHFHVSEDRSNPFSQKNDECSSLSARRCQKYLVRRNCDSSSYIRVTSVESYGLKAVCICSLLGPSEDSANLASPCEPQNWSWRPQQNLYLNLVFDHFWEAEWYSYSVIFWDSA